MLFERKGGRLGRLQQEKEALIEVVRGLYYIGDRKTVEKVAKQPKKMFEQRQFNPMNSRRASRSPGAHERFLEQISGGIVEQNEEIKTSTRKIGTKGTPNLIQRNCFSSPASSAGVQVANERVNNRVPKSEAVKEFCRDVAGKVQAQEESLYEAQVKEERDLLKRLLLERFKGRRGHVEEKATVG